MEQSVLDVENQIVTAVAELSEPFLVQATYKHKIIFQQQTKIYNLQMTLGDTRVRQQGYNEYKNMLSPIFCHWSLPESVEALD